MSNRFELLPGLRVIVNQVVYDPSLSAPEDRPHPFVYFITIANGSDQAVMIFGRKWIVRDLEDRVEVYEGHGVVGQFPRIEPGEEFKYHSYHVVRSESRATGAFFGTTDSGSRVCVQVPEFVMNPPAEW
ncbi:MAG: ApaG domain-containing protein [Verrucomicrobiaceae bacterium]|nr:ApaG domain-containing protein [Verrucomicrobiaceae bacterium]